MLAAIHTSAIRIIAVKGTFFAITDSASTLTNFDLNLFIFDNGN